MRTLAGLAAESDVFDNLIERATLRTELAALGLEPLLAELSVRHVPEDRVGDELEFAWWQSALEHLLRTDRALLGANTAVVDRLERDFRLVDEAHAAASGPLLAAQLATQWRIGIVDHPDEAAALKRALKRGATSTPAELAAVAPDAAAHARAGVARVAVRRARASPTTPRVRRRDRGGCRGPLPRRGRAGAAPRASGRRLRRPGDAEADAVPRRGRRRVAPTTDEPPAEPFDETSVFERLAELLPVETLTRSYRAGGEDLAELVNDAFYGGELVSLPWAGSYLGRGSLSVDYVEGGTGAPDPVTGAVESPDAEVARVVTLVVEHAVNRGDRVAHGRHREREARRAHPRRRRGGLRRPIGCRRLRLARHRRAASPC